MLDDAGVSKVRSIISEVLEREQFDDNAHLVVDLGADSMRLLQILTRLEESFEVYIDQSNLALLVNLESACQIVDEALGS